MRFVKYLLVIIVIFIAIALAAPFFLDPNDFKGEIATAVEDATGRKLDINGDLNLSVFPWLGIKTGELNLGNRQGFQGKSFATIESAQIRVKLIPLLSSKIEMDSLQLNGLNLHLQQLKNGQNNWSDLSSKQADTKKDSSDTPKIAALAIGGIDITDSNIRYQDAVSNQDIKLTELNLQTGALELGATVDIELSTKLSARQPDVNGALNITSEFKGNPFDGTYQLNNSRIVADLKGKTLPGGRLQGTLDATIAANLIAQTMKLSNLKVSSDPLSITGNMDISKLLSSNPTLAGKLNVAKFSPKELLAKLKIAVPDMSDEKALSQASFDTNIGGSLAKINLSNLKLILDDSLIQGKISLRNNKRQSINYDLALDQIDLDRYLPETASAKQAASFSLIPTAIAAPTPAPLFPVDLLRSFDMAGNIKAGQLIMNRLKIENINVKINQSFGFLKIEPIKGLAYNGNYLGNIRIDARKQQGQSPVVTTNESLTNVSIGPVIKTITGKDALTGKGNVSAVLNTRGQSIPALKQNLGGEIKISVSDGVLKGIDVLKTIKDTYAKYKNQASSTSTGKGETPFAKMNVSFQIQNGIMRSQDLVITSELPLIRGEGDINLNNDTIDYTLKTSLEKSLVDAVGIDKSLAGLPLRINVAGNLANPSYSVDWLRLIGRALEKSQKEKLLDSLLGRESKKAAPASPTAPAPTAPETAEERKKRKKQEDKDKVKDLLKGLF